MIRSILVALDGSPRAKGVLRRAVELAELSGAALHLLRAIVVPQEFPAAAAGGSMHDEVKDLLVEEAESSLAELAAGEPGAAGAKLIVAAGTPWRTIVSRADALGVDLIVLGSHGYKGLDRLLGTTAGNVANQAKIDVLIVHDRPVVSR